MLRAHFPQLDIQPVRGNVGTRLAKLDRGDFDALLMAAAGLKRLGLADRIRQILPTTSFLPAPGQGALGIEILSGNAAAATLVAPLEHAATRATAMAERAVSRLLGGSCEVPLAAHAQIEAGQLHLRALVGNHRSGEFVDVKIVGAIDDGERIAAAAVADLKARGALRLLAQ
jgi:hydroxymethylbilane synthase